MFIHDPIKDEDIFQILPSRKTAVSTFINSFLLFLSIFQSFSSPVCYRRHTRTTLPIYGSSISPSLCLLKFASYARPPTHSVVHLSILKIAHLCLIVAVYRHFLPSQAPPLVATSSCPCPSCYCPQKLCCQPHCRSPWSEPTFLPPRPHPRAAPRVPPR